MLRELVVAFFVFIFLYLFIYVMFEYVMKYLHTKYQHLYSYYDDRYSRGLRKGCLSGCTPEGTCPGGNFCYDDQGPNPSCCAYDFQCNSCKQAYDKTKGYGVSQDQMLTHPATSPGGIGEYRKRTIVTTPTQRAIPRTNNTYIGPSGGAGRTGRVAGASWRLPITTFKKEQKIPPGNIRFQRDIQRLRLDLQDRGPFGAPPIEKYSNLY